MKSEEITHLIKTFSGRHMNDLREELASLKRSRVEMLDRIDRLERRVRELDDRTMGLRQLR